MKREFAQRNAAMLADVADHRKLGLSVDAAVLQRLAKLHDVPVPQLDPDDRDIRRDRNALDRLTVSKALKLARAERAERQRLERLERASVAEQERATLAFLNTAHDVPAHVVANLAAKYGLAAPVRRKGKWVGA